MSKYKKAMFNVHIIEGVVNIFWCNIRQAKQIENSPSSFKEEVKCQDQEINILDLLLELSYPSINKF